MSTKLSNYASGVMEASWLVAIIMAPLFFNKYSSRIFEPDKATLLRSLTLIMLLAWIVKLVTDQELKQKGKLKDFFKSLIRTPLVFTVILLGSSYLISTIFSVAPRISFWGSYQRLQGFYTTFSYILLFITLVANLRSSAQVDRLLTTIILTSLPISLYGILQHFGIDPIPWGGDVTRRVASHMGNPIFVAAFLIMVFPLTIGRIVDAFHKILTETTGLWIQTARATIYIFIVSLQLIAIYFTQSRGPWLGLFSGGFTLFVLLSIFWQKRKLTFVFIGIAILSATFLVVLNIPDGPLQNLQSMDSFRRLGQLLDPQSRTAQVRSLIWGGAAEMVSPHDPLEYPDGRKDIFNLVRPIIGYGPETMHWAYNRFYPPELAYVEARNASPDRSHNETWDTLVFTGVFGFLIYLSLFTGIFYYGLKWLGLIRTSKFRIIFFSVYFGSGIISAVIFSFWQGIAFAGLGLPFGLILGLILYLAIVSLIQGGIPSKESINPIRSLTLIVLLSAVISHFAEINFGISIVSTKTTFFAYSALIISVGTVLPKLGQYPGLSDHNKTDYNSQVSNQSQMRTTRSRRRYKSETSVTLQAGLKGGLITTFLILPMYYEYISNLGGLKSASTILWTSLTQVNQDLVSYGVLALVITTWVCASIILTAESILNVKKTDWWKILGIVSGISFLATLLYAVLLSGSLASLARMEILNINDVISQTKGLERLLSQFYSVLILFVLSLGWFLPTKWTFKSHHNSFFNVILTITGFFIVIWLSMTTNLRIIQADIAFKMAEPFANSQQWMVANTLYHRSIDLSPDEDLYYLMLGRGSHEYAKTLSDPTELEDAFKTAEADLFQAQTISPLNPDHTRNLARLHSWWAIQAEDEVTRIQRGKVSDTYFQDALNLSPNNVQIWNEWASLQYQVFNDLDKTLELISHSLEIDPRYDWTHALAGDVYSSQARITQDNTTKKEIFSKAVYHYTQAINYQPEAVNYYFALANVYYSLGETINVINTLENSMLYAPEDDLWKIEDHLTQNYLELNDFDNALIYAQRAFTHAPQTELERLSALIEQIQSLP